MQQSIAINIIEPGSGNLPLGPGSEDLPQLGAFGSFFTEHLLMFALGLIFMAGCAAVAIYYSQIRAKSSGGGHIKRS